MTDEDRELDELKHKIHRERGFNSHYYKDKCLRRRIGVRMRVRGQESFAAYSSLLDADPHEYDLLIDALTINVSNFFRNAEVWDVLREAVVPSLFEGEGERRVWSAGAAGGEEAYSLAILLHEWAERHGRLAELGRFRIVGTDIDRRILEAAGRAEYPELALDETPPDVRVRWFSPGLPYRLDPRATRNVSFLRHDLISDPPPDGQSLILCRNVIIYFDRQIQEELFVRFHDALLPGGFLVLGKVETLLGPARARFRVVGMRERVFQKPA